jgi:predicted amidohydrolase
MLRVAAAQTPGTQLEDWRETLHVIRVMVERAAAENANVVLLPECVWPAYFLSSTDDYFRAREAGMPGHGAFLEQLAALARQHRLSVCAGYVAEDGGRLYNAASLVSATGDLLGAHHKCFLWDFDHDLFDPGDSITPVNTPWGPVGLMICADARMPEISATLAARGARLILQPTAWVNCGTAGELWNPQPELFIPERAREFGVPIASASKWGVEGDTTFVGSSVICDGAGNTAAHCGTSETRLIVADVGLGSPRTPRLTTEQRKRLRARGAPTLPQTRVGRLRVALLEERAERVEAFGSSREHSPKAPVLFLRCPRGPERSEGSTDRGDNWLLITSPIDEVHMLGAIRIGAVRDRDADSFAALRSLAISGVHAVAIFGEKVADRTLRCRAAENRVYLLHVTATGLRAYDPRGFPAGVLAAPDARRPRPNSAATQLELDVDQSADKCFAPRTDALAARTPELYEF